MHQHADGSYAMPINKGHESKKLSSLITIRFDWKFTKQGFPVNLILILTIPWKFDSTVCTTENCCFFPFMKLEIVWWQCWVKVLKRNWSLWILKTDRYQLNTKLLIQRMLTYCLRGKDHGKMICNEIKGGTERTLACVFSEWPFWGRLHGSVNQVPYCKWERIKVKLNVSWKTSMMIIK